MVSVNKVSALDRCPECRESLFDRVVAAATPIPEGKKDAFFSALKDLERHARLNISFRELRSPSALEKKFHAIAVAANELLGKLGANGDAPRIDMPEQVREGLKHFARAEATGTDDDMLLDDNIESIRQIFRWANQAKRQVNAHKGSADPKAILESEIPYAEQYEFDIIEGVYNVWTRILKRPPEVGFNKSKGKASGPFINFAMACHALFGLEATPDSLRYRIRNLAKLDREKI